MKGRGENRGEKKRGGRGGEDERGGEGGREFVLCPRKKKVGARAASRMSWREMRVVIQVGEFLLEFCR